MTSVFVFAVSDIDADSWHAELAVVAATRGQAHRILRTRGVRSKQFLLKEQRPVRELALPEVSDWLTDPSRIYRRRLDDGGWTMWEPVPDHVSLDWRVSGRARRIGPGGRVL
jgi:hypothetical protein